jgi:hypothetical protein
MRKNHFTVHRVLNGSDLSALEDFARHPARTIDECRAWIRDRGHKVSRSAVGRWLKDFRSEVRDMAIAVASAVRAKDGARPLSGHQSIAAIAADAAGGSITVRIGEASVCIPPGSRRKDVSIAVQAVIEASKK